MSDLSSGEAIYGPRVPFFGELPALQNYQRIVIDGIATENCGRFDVNLAHSMDKDSIAFHFNPRFFQNCVVRNALLNYAWGPEELDGEMPFQPSQNFQIQIDVEEEFYQVLVNGSYFCKFEHRSPKQDVRFLIIDAEGELQIHSIQMSGPGLYSSASSSEEKAPPRDADITPLQEPAHMKVEVEGGLDGGKVVKIDGKTRPQSDRFIINFMLSDDDDENMIMHFNPRFSESTVIRNMQIGKNWGSEERSQPNFPFQLDTDFSMAIVCDPRTFKISVNGEHFVDFPENPHRSLPLSQVKAIIIKGDVDISKCEVHSRFQ